MNFGTHIIPEEYLSLAKLIFVLLIVTICVFSFVRTLVSNKKRVEKYEKKHGKEARIEYEKKHKLQKSATIRLVKQLFCFHVLYGVLFINLWQALLTGIIFLICLIACSIHWKSTKCKDFADFFAVKSGWLTSIVLLGIGEFLVGSIFGNILPRVLMVVASIGALWLISLIHTLLRFKKYYNKKDIAKIEDPKNPEEPTKPEELKKPENPKKPEEIKKPDVLKKPDNNIKSPLDELVPSDNNIKSPLDEIEPPAIDETGTRKAVGSNRECIEGKHIVIDEETPVSNEFEYTEMDKPISIEILNASNKTLNPQPPLNTLVVSGNLEEQLKSQMISVVCGYIKLYYDKKASDELVGDATTVKELTTFDPSIFKNINLGINVSPTSNDETKEDETSNKVNEENNEKAFDEAAPQEKPKDTGSVSLILDTGSKPQTTSLYLNVKDDKSNKNDDTDEDKK